MVLAAVLALRNLTSFYTEPDDNTIRTAVHLAAIPGFEDRSVPYVRAFGGTYSPEEHLTRCMDPMPVIRAMCLNV